MKQPSRPVEKRALQSMGLPKRSCNWRYEFDRKIRNLRQHGATELRVAPQASLKKDVQTSPYGDDPQGWRHCFILPSAPDPPPATTPSIQHHQNTAKGAIERPFSRPPA
ncbi:MAG: hypothetical protein WA840_00965, partial [Caulobacteraceae bacterium]